MSSSRRSVRYPARRTRKSLWARGRWRARRSQRRSLEDRGAGPPTTGRQGDQFLGRGPRSEEPALPRALRRQSGRLARSRTARTCCLRAGQHRPAGPRRRASRRGGAPRRAHDDRPGHAAVRRRPRGPVLHRSHPGRERDLPALPDPVTVPNLRHWPQPRQVSWERGGAIASGLQRVVRETFR
jgi:hypothetical protein